jgi:hypothetical protein
MLSAELLNLSSLTETSKTINKNVLESTLFDKTVFNIINSSLKRILKYLLNLT